MKMRLKIFAWGIGILLPLFSFAVAQQTSIITRPGVVTSPVKYYFDLSSALAGGVNHSIKVIVSASNTEKTAVRFESVKLFDQSGATLGNNVASKTDALSSTPYSFVFQNFGVSAEDLRKVAGVELKFLDLGGDNPAGKVTVQNVTMSLDRNVGEACIIADPLLIPILPPPTVVAIQTSRPLEPRGGGAAATSGGGGGGGATSQGPNSPSSITEVSSGGVSWSSLSNALTDNGSGATAGGNSGQHTNGLVSTGYNFSIPTGATVDGIEIVIKRKSTITSVADAYVAITRAEATSGTSYNYNSGSATWPSSYENKTFGSSTTLPSDGYTYDPSDVNNSAFGVYLRASFAAPDTANVDVVTLKVYYTPLGGSVYDSLMDLLRSLGGRFKFK